MNLHEHLKNILQQNEKFAKDGELFKNTIVEAALKLEPSLLKILLKDEKTKKHFFEDVEGITVFDKIKFQKFVSNKQFLPDSYTTFKNKIGLTANREYLTEAHEIVLDFPYKDCILEGGQTKEEQKERKEIFWNETLAPDEIDLLLEPKTLTNWKKYDKDGQHEVKTLSLNDNFIIKGNNLLALHSLKKIYKGKIKLIYIDPPYNTGNDSFNYNDSFNHSTWLTFMKNRLEVARELLSEEGTFAISIDHNEIGYIVSLADEIFGSYNRKNIISIKRSSVSGAKVINPGVVNVSEFLIIYSKKSSSWKPNKVYKSKQRDSRYNNFIENKEDEPTKWTYSSVLDAFAKSLSVEKSKLKKFLAAEYEIKLEEFYFSNKDKIIRFAGLDDKSISAGVKEVKYLSKSDNTKTYIFERENHNHYYLYKGNAILFFADRLIQIGEEWKFGEMISDIWNDVLPNDIHNEGGVTLRKGKKPEKLIERLINLATKENDLVLDFNLGSGTTAAVALKSNRRFIGIEQLDYGKNDSVQRLKNVINGEQSGISKAYNWQGGGSFVYAELKKYNALYIEMIEEATTKENLLEIWQEMKSQSFLSYQVNIEEIDKNSRLFEELDIENQKKFLVSILDKNLLYVNYSEIEDQTYKVSNEDKALNIAFYENILNPNL